MKGKPKGILGRQTKPFEGKNKSCLRCSLSFFAGGAAKYCLDCKQKVIGERQRILAQLKRNGKIKV